MNIQNFKRGFIPLTILFLVGAFLMAGILTFAPQGDVFAAAPVCGDGILKGPEECDDGNVVNGDGCDKNCTFTACGNGVVSPDEDCDDGNAIDTGNGCSDTCTLNHTCGDGELEDQVEECDDGNTDDLDRCTNFCVAVDCPSADFDYDSLTNTWTIDPSGDGTGTLDHRNINCALLEAADSGEYAVVELTGGDFSVNKPINTYNFNGTLKGAGMEDTTVTAVRKSAAEGFASVFVASTNILMPEMIIFQNPTGYLGLNNLTLQVLDDNPTDPYVSRWGWTETTALNDFVAVIPDFETEINTVISNVGFIGDAGDFRERDSDAGKNVGTGKNVGYGIVLIGGIGDVTIEDSIFENINGAALQVYSVSNASVNIKDNHISDSGRGIYLDGHVNSSGLITGNEIINGEGSVGIGISMANDVIIEKNTIKNFKSKAAWGGAPINLAMSKGSTIRNNILENVYDPEWYGPDEIVPSAGILISAFVAWYLPWSGLPVPEQSSNNTVIGNDFSLSGLPGFVLNEDEVIVEPGSVLLAGNLPLWIIWPYDDPQTPEYDAFQWHWHVFDGTYDNHVAEPVMGNKFPPGTNLCTQVYDMTDDPGLNDISGYEACEVPEWEIILERLQDKLKGRSGVPPGIIPDEYLNN